MLSLLITHMKGKNLSDKTDANLKSKCSEDVAEKSFTLYSWSEVEV